MTLYEQLGGAPAVAALLDGLYDRAAIDPLLRPFLEGLDLDRLKQQQYAFISQAIGGPDQYAGRSLASAHARLRVEDRHFDAFVEIVAAVLNDLGVAQDVAAEVVSRVAAVRSLIVKSAAARA